VLVWLASYPRSGNSLFRGALSYRFAAKVAADTPPPKNPGPLWLRTPVIHDVHAARADPEPVFVKTHQRPVDDCPAICVVRDGRDATASYARWLKAVTKDFADWPTRRIARRLIDGHKAGKRALTWAEAVETWIARDATEVVRFEDALADDPVPILCAALDRLGVPYALSDRAAPSFAELQRVKPEMFRRGETGNWRDELPPRLEERFWRSQGQTMEKLGYHR
jgi:hypothetical protein